jgi:uncharacterized protein (TIGR00290 family)
MKEKVIVAWSGGKDSALALYETLRSGRYEVLNLLTTVSEGYDEISIHGVRRVLLEQQANALDIPLDVTFVSKGASDEEYERELLKALKRNRDGGVSSVVFGDIFLEDIRKYREHILPEAGLDGIFPLWKKDTQALARRFINLGFKAIITSVDAIVLGKDFAGRAYDERFLASLPANVDPCGENGEFHSFVHDGPIFNRNVSFTKGKTMLRQNRFYSCDLLPKKEI